MNKLIFTYTVSQWYLMPEAMLKMAEVAHNEGVPVNWQVSFETALAEKAYLDKFHTQYGDEILIIKGNETIEDWKNTFPWATLNIVGNARPDKNYLNEIHENGFEGLWGYCDFQVGTDGISHWGCPWGMFRLSNEVPIIPSSSGDIIGIPWTIRDIHKTYNLGQPINFGVDPIEFIRSGTLDKGDNITFFSDLFDELMENTRWNERVYCCLHEEANGPYVPEGRECSDEGATREQGQDMYKMLGGWIRYAKENGAKVMTLPEALEDYKKVSNGKVIPSTLLTHDKFHGRIRHYVIPFPQGTQLNEMGSAGNFPDTIFHYDQDCMLVFKTPEIQPEMVLNYKAAHKVEAGKLYPREPVLPTLWGWETKRSGNTRTYEYKLSSWYSMPYGLVEWGNFKGWKVLDSNCESVKMVGERALLLRFNIDVKEIAGGDANIGMQNGMKIWVKLEKTKD